MAVSIMSACCRASVLSLHLLACFLQVLSHGEVFRQAPQAHSVLLRSRRANTFLLEELLQGNLERECYEELCNFEEAREYFEDNEKTIAFWTVYYDGNQCEPNPCLHGGNCTDKVGGFTCSCTAPNFGQTCELGVLELRKRQWHPVPRVTTPGWTTPTPWPAPPPWRGAVYERKARVMAECPTEGPTACHQLCTASYRSFTCSCLSGFTLQTDKRSCVPEVDFPCGRLDKFNTTASMCRHGNCPWQVTLLNSRGAELCAGVVLGRRSVLTAARCLLLDSGSTHLPSSLYVVAGNDKRLVRIQALYIHDRFHSDHHDNDLALLQLATPLTFGPALIHLCLPEKDFSENILMNSGRTGVAGRRRGGRLQDLVYMTLDECRSQMNVSHPLSNKMFCMRRQIGERGRQVGPLGSRHEARRSSRNQTQISPSGARGPGRAENHNSGSFKIGNQTPSVADGYLRSEVNSRRCSALLPGSPVATVEQGTAFLTGLLISSPAGCDGGGGLVFTKLSRYLHWIRPRLEVAEAHMTPQVSQYPETH